MQVVKSVDLRDIDLIRIWEEKSGAFMSRHMKRIGFARCVFL